MDICYVQLGSTEWQEARNLRYALFFEVHGLPFGVMDDQHETNAVHLVAKECDRVVGYGRLTKLKTGHFQISQMVVHPSHKRRGIGQALLTDLLRYAENSGATEVTLNARIEAVAFYEKAGFLRSGEIFLSQNTGVPYVAMKIYLKRERRT